MTFDTVREILSQQLEIDPAIINYDTDILDDLGADSLDVVELIMAIEEEYDIVITDDRAVGLRTVGQLTELLDQMV